MCGIVGVAGSLLQKDEGLIKRLLLFDYLRGADGTGLASIRCDGDIRIAKQASDPITLFDSMKFNLANSGAASKALIGHNRFATRGGKTNSNSHPFQFDHITGAHNGTLDQGSWNVLEDAIGEKFPVDSMAVMAAIAKLGIKETISLCEEGKEPTTGAWSLVWHDKKDDSLNFLRNGHRPMWLGYEKGFKRLFWSSEWWMMQAAFNSVPDAYDLYVEEGTGFKYFPTDEDIHMKFSLAELEKGAETVPKPIIEKIKGREPPPVSVTQGSFPIMGHGNVCGFQQSQKEKKKGKSGSSTISTTTSHSDNVLHWLGTKSSPYAGYISEDKFKELAKYGCVWCQADLEYGDAVIYYERDDIFVCPACAGVEQSEEEVTRIYAKPDSFAALQ